MVSVDNDAQTSPTLALVASWQATMILGALTVILGLVVSFHPTGSLNVVAVLLGILMILSGIFHLIPDVRLERSAPGMARYRLPDVHRRRRCPDPSPGPEQALIGLVIGITWIVQGLTVLIRGMSGDVREGRAWWIIFWGGERPRRNSRRQYPGVVPECPRRLARHLVRHHGHLRDHRSAHAPARASSRGAVTHLTAHPRRMMPALRDAVSLMRRAPGLEGDSVRQRHAR